ncbi:mediator of RNA polymerase II transcription subunit 7 [Lepidopterella palustris CBS 459.81]|uniref:Mediator of RNA polymerase II transcription subunit 7 n=1 Tax=Lepidopterella palustris CBS 459.81 TaxID=1314670 RepID=A0A8E2J9H0_9PEZI|nr:mediator of RNA polymerase II transcription subunit 7 [Lepidopterella palustris CBS 459.81]
MEEEEGQLSTTFPQPPPFYKHFTTQNLERLKELQDDASETKDDPEATSASPNLLDLPPELRYLIPPQPPADGKYRAFGIEKNVNEPLLSLKDMGQEQLYPSSPASPAEGAEGVQSDWTLDRAFYLKNMARSILLNFLELVGVLSINATQFGEKIDHLKTLFVNSHHLINEYRPHQARETLILMMEDQLEKKKAEVEGIKRMKQKIDDTLAGLGKSALDEDDGIGGQKARPSSPDERRKEEQRLMWHVLYEELGS